MLSGWRLEPDGSSRPSANLPPNAKRVAGDISIAEMTHEEVGTHIPGRRST